MGNELYHRIGFSTIGKPFGILAHAVSDAISNVATSGLQNEYPHVSGGINFEPEPNLEYRIILKGKGVVANVRAYRATDQAFTVQISYNGMPSIEETTLALQENILRILRRAETPLPPFDPKTLKERGKYQ